MEEEEVVKAVTAWLETRFPGSSVQREVSHYVDIMAIKRNGVYPQDPEASMTFLAQVECKGTQNDPATAIGKTDAALGQSLRYLAMNGPPSTPTFLAVPEDFYGLDLLRTTIERLHLELGLLIVSANSTVNLAKQPGTSPPTRLIKDMIQIR